MKVGVISDTHVAGVSLAPKKLASRIINKVNTSAVALCESIRPHFEGVDLILHSGDFVSADVITALEEFAPVEGVAGNMDGREITSRFPYERVVTAGGFKIGMMHGYGPATGLEIKIRRRFEDVDMIVFGHSHHPFAEEVFGILMFNPGSPTDKRWAPSHAIGILELDKEIRTKHIALP